MSTEVSQMYYYNIVNVNSGLCVDRSGCGTTNGTSVQQ